MNHRKILTIAAVTSIFLLNSLAHAEWVPKRPINAIVPYGAGGGTDSIARAVTSSIGDALPVPVVIVNKPGSSGILGATAVANAKADGSSILITSAGSLVLNSIMKDLKFDPFEDFVPIAQVGDLTTAVMVPVSSPYKTMADLITAAKDKPDGLRWAHTGRGSFHHVAGQGFLNSAGITAVDVPFKGGSATRAAVIGEQVDFGMIGIQQVAGFEDQLRPLALVAANRDSFAAEVPTFAELGIAVPLITSPIVVFAPAATAEEVIEKLQLAIKSATEAEAFVSLMAKAGNTAAYLPGLDTKAKLLMLHEEAKAIVKDLTVK